MNRSKITEGIFQPRTLDVDENILDRNLKIVDDGEALFGLPKSVSGIKKPLLSSEDNIPAVAITPTPGLCVKTKNIAGEKVFINLCKIQEIPPPPPLSEEKLQDIISNEDYSTTFRVPMSLGAPREEKDKSGAVCLACDVAINTMWLEETMFDSITFTTFVINLAMEGLCEKYGDQVNLDRQHWTILKNKKYLGALQRHHIQQRANNPGSNAKITELDSEKPPKIKVHAVKPKFVIIKEPKDWKEPNFLMATIDLPGLISKEGILLDVGEDRLVLETCKGQKYHLDIFLPFTINQDGCSAQFNIKKTQLNVKMPLINSEKIIEI